MACWQATTNITATCSTLSMDACRACAGYPEAYFARLALPAEAVMAVVAACRSDDIYHQVRPVLAGAQTVAD